MSPRHANIACGAKCIASTAWNLRHVGKEKDHVSSPCWVRVLILELAALAST